MAYSGKLPAGAEAGAGGQIVSFMYNPAGLLTGLRNLLGQYTSIQGKVLDAHRAMAEQIRQAQIEELEEAIAGHRRSGVQRSSNYLIRAMEAEGYAPATRQGFTVNPEGYLDSSSARSYWRNLEQGSAVHEGRAFYGFFRTGSRVSGPSLFQRDIELIQSIGTVGAGAGQKGSADNPIKTIQVGQGRRGADNLSKTAPIVGRGKRGGYLIVIKNPIPPYAYLQKGIENWEARNDIADTYRENGIAIVA